MKLKNRILSYLSKRKTPATTTQIIAGASKVSPKAEVNSDSIKRNLQYLSDSGDIVRNGRKSTNATSEMTWSL